MKKDRSTRLAWVMVRQAAVYEKQNATSWLDPGGNFHPITFSHDDWAARNGTSLDELFVKGWLRITHGYKDLVVENASPTRINERQRGALIDFAIASKWFTEVVDYSGDRERVLWSSQDE